MPVLASVWFSSTGKRAVFQYWQKGRNELVAKDFWGNETRV